MKIIKQLFRRVGKTIAGILLIALALAILIASAGQFTSTNLAKENLSDNYSTVAVISDKYYWAKTENGAAHRTQITDEKARNWAEDIVQSRDDIFLGESFTEVYSAYAPNIMPDNSSKYETGDIFFTPIPGNTYRCALLEVSLSAVGTLRGEYVNTVWTSNGTFDLVQYKTMLCVGTVEKVIGLESGFSSPVGKTIAFIVKADKDETLDAMELEVGGRYLIYGMDYFNATNNIARSRIIEHEALFVELFGPPQMEMGEPEYSCILEQFDCYMTVFDYASIPVVYADENGCELRAALRETYTRTGFNEFITSYVPAEEFVPKYTVPTVAKLEGTAEEYLQSEGGTLWRQMLDNMEISNHGFPVLAVDKIGYQMAFIRKEARIVEGRDFTETERTEGAKVCVLSETVALQNNLSVGDTLRLQTYGHDYNIQVQLYNMGAASSFPFAAIYSPAMGFTSEMEEYEIVGLYRQINAWENTDDPYGITPNTIFVPKGSITGDARTGTKGIFYSLVLHNGKMQELQKLQNQAGYPDLFLCFDQGYSKIVKALDAYEGVSQKAFYIGAASCGVILLLFLALFPLQQGKNLSIMCSLGAPRSKRIGFVVGSSLGILLPGAILGGTAGALLWKQVATTLMESVNVTIPMSANTLVLALSLSAALLLVSLALVTLLAVCISGDKGLSKRK